MPSRPESSPPTLKQPGTYWGGFWAAVQFLSLCPPVIRRPFKEEELGAAVGFFPLVGAGLGLLLAATGILFGKIFPSGLSAVLVLAMWIILTGALHLDGFLDACDGLLGGHDPTSRLQIMRDEHHGAFGLAGGVLLLLAKWEALQVVHMEPAVLVLALAAARWGMAVAVFGYPYARPQGVGRSMKDFAGRGELGLATVFVGIIAWITAGWSGLLVLGLVGIVVWVGARLVLRLIPGLTGDVYGALNELSELSVLLFFAAGRI